jgi:hypothetical protein
MYRASSGAERLVEFGTTCTAAVVQQGRLLIGNAGDSSAVLGRCFASKLQHHILCRCERLQLPSVGQGSQYLILGCCKLQSAGRWNIQWGGDYHEALGEHQKYDADVAPSYFCCYCPSALRILLEIVAAVVTYGGGTAGTEF